MLGVSVPVGSPSDFATALGLVGVIVTIWLTSRRNTSEGEKWLREGLETRIKSLEAQVGALTIELKQMRENEIRMREERDLARRERDQALQIIASAERVAGGVGGIGNLLRERMPLPDQPLTNNPFDKERDDGTG